MSVRRITTPPKASASLSSADLQAQASKPRGHKGRDPLHQWCTILNLLSPKPFFKRPAPSFPPMSRFSIDAYLDKCLNDVYADYGAFCYEARGI